MLRSLPRAVFLFSDSPGSMTLPAVLEETEIPECRSVWEGLVRQELMVLWDMCQSLGLGGVRGQLLPSGSPDCPLPCSG